VDAPFTDWQMAVKSRASGACMHVTVDSPQQELECAAFQSRSEPEMLLLAALVVARPLS
jgi:hypothetical protein